MNENDDLPQRDRWARLRYAIIGPLLAAPPADGELSAALNVLAEKTWRHPFTGLDMRFGCSTLERWYYAAKKAADPVLALRNQVRRDIGRFPSVSAEAVRELTAQYHQHPSWAAKLHSDNLRVVLVTINADAPCPSYASVRRYLRAHGLLRKRSPRRNTAGAIAARDRLEQREVRSYEVERVLQLIHLNFHHGSRKVLTRQGKYVIPLLVCFIDDRSRYVAHMQWYMNEATEQLVHGLCQALQKVGLPRSIMNDRGSAMMSAEFYRASIWMAAARQSGWQRITRHQEHAAVDCRWQALISVLWSFFNCYPCAVCLRGRSSGDFLCGDRGLHELSTTSATI